MAIIVTGDMYYGIDGQLLEIKRQMRQHEGYPYRPEDLQKALQEIIEGRFGPPVDDRFSLMLMSEPIIIPTISISACVEKYRSSMAIGMDSMIEWDFQPSEPLRSGCEYRLCVYITRRSVSEIDCIEFIKQQGGVLPNFHGLFIALEKDLLPKNNTCVISALDKEVCLASAIAHGRRVVPTALCIEAGGRHGLNQGNRLQWQFWGAGIHKGSCIMFFK